MRIAYLILVHDNPKHLKRLINALAYENSHIFLHVDQKADLDSFPAQSENVSIIKNRVAVTWGRYTMVQATLNLLQEAVSFGTFDYYVLLSGTSYPLRSSVEIQDFFQKNKGSEFINSLEMSETTKSLNRIEYFLSSDGANIWIFKIIKKIMELCRIKRRFSKKYSWVKPYAGSQWWALSDSCVNYVLKFISENPQFVNYFRYTWIPDEMFFQIIVGNSPFNKQIKPHLMYTDWFFSKWTPQILNKEHFWIINEILQTPKDAHCFLFARKFDDKSDEIINLIDTHFRRTTNVNGQGVGKDDLEDNQKISAPKSKYLVFTSAGDNSNLHHWLLGNRNFDLWITYYGAQGHRYRDISDFYNIRKGCKFPNFHYVYQKWRNILDHYEAIILLDDDIIINGSDISRMFEVRKKFDFWICQPAFKPKGKISHEITRVKPLSFARYVDFVENNCPLFRKDKLDAFMKVYDPTLLSYGVDWWYLDFFRKESKFKIAVIDAISCINPFDSAKGGESEINQYLNRKERIKIWKGIKEKYHIQIDEENYTEFGLIKDFSKNRPIDGLKYIFASLYYRILEIINRSIYQIRHSRFYANLHRLPVHLEIKILLIKIKIFLGLSLNTREKYLDQLLDLLTNAKGVCVKEDPKKCIVRFDLGLKLDLYAIEENPAVLWQNFSSIKKVWKRHFPMVHLILSKLKIDQRSNLKAIYTGLDAGYSTRCLESSFPNLRILCLDPGEAYVSKSKGIVKLLLEQGWTEMDIFIIDIEGVESYLLEEESVGEFLSRIKFLSIRIQANSIVRDRIYHILRQNGFMFSTKDGLTIGFNMKFGECANLN